jgi:hypothetical protein
MLLDVSINWLFTLMVLPLTLIILIENFGLGFVTNDYVRLILEFVFVGMLPLIIVVVRREKWGDYGLTFANWKKSVSYGLLLAMPFIVIKSYAYFFSDYSGWSWSLHPLLLSFYLPVYGPLEAFFVVFSVYKIDRGLSCERLISKGLIFSSILFGLMHAINYLWYPNLTSVLRNYVLGNIIPALFIGLTYKKTNSILGSWFFWTFVNFL